MTNTKLLTNVKRVFATLSVAIGITTSAILNSHFHLAFGYSLPQCLKFHSRVA